MTGVLLPAGCQILVRQSSPVKPFREFTHEHITWLEATRRVWGLGSDTRGSDKGKDNALVEIRKSVKPS